MGYPFIQARNYTKGRISPIKWVVIHDMEMPEAATTAEACANYFAVTTRQASAHYCIDNDSIVQSVKESDTAWAAPGANANGVHLEHAGYANQTSAQWDDQFSRAMLARSAPLTAAICDRYGIPKRHLTVDEVRAGKPGVIGHWDLTLAGVGGNTHTDPGRYFPWNDYMALVGAQEDDMFGDADRELLQYVSAQAKAVAQLVIDLDKREAARDAAYQAAMTEALKGAGVDPAVVKAAVDEAMSSYTLKVEKAVQ